MKSKKENLKETVAKGTEGILIKNIDGSFSFRVYDKDFNFKDYDLIHNDLKVMILDKDASFYESKDQSTLQLDHDSKTLGLKRKFKRRISIF